ncbi:MAG: YbdK family carboxylate-amine ligase [Gemmatimonadetes bacterium]|nr:YbdK family carboxylate-amine ligase [Gemmatimonadota bacterium]
MEQTITGSTMTADFTIGVEEEYQLVDLASGALRSRASDLRREDWTGELVAELQETTIEIGTQICADTADAERQLRRLRLQASTVAASHGLAIVAAGVHPFSSWEGHERPPIERYKSIEARYGRIARDEHIFGMHVHVAVPEHVDRLHLMNTLRHYLPHMLALSASSAFFEGADTGFASYRTILWRRWPNSGIPPRFESATEFRHYVDTLLDAGVMADPWNLYWSMRPHPKFPTVEFRVTDVCPSLRDALALTAFARALVHAAVTGVITDEAPSHVSASLEQELVRINEWCVARDGLESRVVDTMTGRGHRPVRDAIRTVLDRISRSADELGDLEALAHVERILERGNAAERMRALHRGGATLRGLVDWLAAESLVGTGLDRRGAQRESQ